eukprot:3539866-Rhodomonas_salina.1
MPQHQNKEGSESKLTPFGDTPHAAGQEEDRETERDKKNKRERRTHRGGRGTRTRTQRTRTRTQRTHTPSSSSSRKGRGAKLTAQAEPGGGHCWQSGYQKMGLCTAEEANHPSAHA